VNKTVIIILGVTGDLAKRRLIPAVYSLIFGKKIKNFTIIGAAIDDTSMEKVLYGAKEFVSDFDQEIFDELVKNSYYQKLDFTVKEDFTKLETFITSFEQKCGVDCDRLVYVASMPSFFCVITKNCAASGLIKKVSGSENFWHRIVYEKPFGSNGKSAAEINNCLKEYLYEEQVYRVDHYLTKEIVGNIALVRFTKAYHLKAPAFMHGDERC